MLVLLASILVAPVASRSVAAAVPRNAPVDDSGPDAVVPTPDQQERVVGRTVYSRTELAPDGTISTSIGLRPLHWRNAETGEYAEFRNVLETSRASGYAYESSANGYIVRFGNATSVAAGRPILTLQKGAVSVSLALAGASPEAAVVGGNSITYTELFPGVDVRYTLDNERVKEDVILKNASAAASLSSIRFTLATAGVAPAKRSDGSLRFATAAGKAVFNMPRPFLVDGGGVAERSYSSAIGVGITSLGSGRYELRLTPDRAWLDAPERVYPVVLDPVVEDISYTASGAEDVHLFECCPTQNTAVSTSLYVGKNSAGQRRDTLIRFPQLDTLPKGSAITSAYLKLYAQTGTNGLPMEVRANTSAWSEATATWGAAPSMGTTAYGLPTATVPGWNSIYLSGLVRYWVDGTLPNHGLRIFSNGSAGQSVTFHSANSTEADKLPVLEVNYVAATRYGVDDSSWRYHSYNYGEGNSSAVNLSSGALVFRHDGGSLGLTGFDSTLVHSYTSSDTYGQADFHDRPGAFYGEGWTFSENLRLFRVDNGAAMVFKDGSGTNRVYAPNGAAGQYFRPRRYEYSLTKDTSGLPADPTRVYTLRHDFGGDILDFDAEGKLTARSASEGPARWTYLYDALGRLTRIADAGGRAVTLQYYDTANAAGGRLWRITDANGTVHEYEYASGQLTSITDGVGTASAKTTRLGYGVAYHLITVVNPSGQKSYIGHEVKEGWDAAGDARDWRPEWMGTVVAQDALRTFRGTGSLRLDTHNLTSSTLAVAARLFGNAPQVWGATEGELWTFAYVPTGRTLEARLSLWDERGAVTYGPWSRVTGGSWTAVRLPDAHIDPGHKVERVKVQFRVPSGDPSFTGSVWIDNMLVRGMTDFLTNAEPAADRIATYAHDWAGRRSTVTTPAQEGTGTETYASEYNAFGESTEVFEDTIVVTDYTEEGGYIGARTITGPSTQHNHLESEEDDTRTSTYLNETDLRPSGCREISISRRWYTLLGGLATQYWQNKSWCWRRDKVVYRVKWSHDWEVYLLFFFWRGNDVNEGWHYRPSHWPTIARSAHYSRVKGTFENCVLFTRMHFPAITLGEALGVRRRWMAVVNGRLMFHRGRRWTGGISMCACACRPLYLHGANLWLDARLRVGGWDSLSGGTEGGGAPPTRRGTEDGLIAYSFPAPLLRRRGAGVLELAAGEHPDGPLEEAFRGER